MIEKRYTGVAKQGADVVANPTLDGSEENLESIGINGTNYKVGGSDDSLYMKQIKESFTISFIGQYVYDHYLNLISDSLLGIRVENITKGINYIIRVLNGEPKCYDSENGIMLDISEVFYGASLGDITINYITFEPNNYFSEGDEISIYYYEGPLSPIIDF